MKFLSVVSIYDNTDVEGTISRINKGVSMRGANTWILFSAAMLASIGLDVNSSAVIIGAMLISPLMSPIIGIGLGIGISDRDLLLKALTNFGLAVFVSLFSSSLYFALTPLGQPTTEMLARTTPTLLDVGVAIFGGVAGIVANSRREMSNAIPGVAIATALMPPLCTAGYGIANLNANFFFGAFYLFFINAVFISLSTYIIVRLLQFPYIKFLDDKNKRKIQRWIGIFAFLVMIPSAYIFYNVVVEARMKRNIKQFIEVEINNEKYEALEWNVLEGDTIDVLKLFVIGEPIPQEKFNEIKAKMKDYNLDKMGLRAVQMNVPESERDRIKQEVAGEIASNIMQNMQVAEDVKKESDIKIDSLESVITRLKVDESVGNSIEQEISVLFPEILDVDFGTSTRLDTNNNMEVIPIAILDMDRKYGSYTRQKAIDKFEEFLKIRLEKDTLIILSK